MNFNMRKTLYITLSFLAIAAVSIPHVNAQTKTPTPTVAKNTPTESEEIKNIERIKDIVASRVAELNLVEKKGIIGTVQEADNSQVTIKDTKGNTRIIEVDELTNFDGGSDDKDDSFGVTDLAKGTLYSFVGSYNKDTKRLLARKISQPTSIPLSIDGVITEIDAKGFQITITDADGKEKKVDIENSTKTFSLEDGDEEAVKSGFTKLEVGQRIIVTGFGDKTDKELMSASRIIHFIDLPPSKKMQQYVELPSPTPVEEGEE